MKKILLANLAIFLLGAGVAQAAPTSRLERTLIPETNSTYYLGTTSPSVTGWKGLITDQICLTSDTCRTTWPGAGTVIGTISTSSTPVIGQLPYWTSTGYPSLQGSVATTSLTATSPLSLSQPISVIGTSASALTISTAGTWSGLAGTASALAPGNTINGTTFTGASPITINAASSTLLIDANTFSNVGTTTFSGNAHVVGNLQVDGGFYAPVTLVASGNTTINGALTVTGATTLATSLTGLLKAASGLVSVASAGVDYENPLTFSFPLIRSTNAISWGGLSTSSPLSAGLLYATGVNTMASVATSSPIQMDITGNAGTVTNGVYTSTFNGLFDNRLSATTTLPNLTTLLGLTNASTTQLSVGSSNQFYVKPTGEIIGTDIVNNWTGQISPTRTLVSSIATSTGTWTGTSTPGVDSSPNLAAPFAGTIRKVRCPLNAFLGVQITINGTAVTPSYFVASSTVGTENITANNTFAVGDKILVNYGTTTTATAASGVVNGSCSLDTTETP